MSATAVQKPRYAKYGLQEVSVRKWRERISEGGSVMSTVSEQLEERVAILEAEVAHLKSKLEVVSLPTKPWWERIAGTFADNSAYDEAMQLGREYRESLHSGSVESRDG